MMRTACIRLKASPQQAARLSALRTATSTPAIGSYRWCRQRAVESGSPCISSVTGACGSRPRWARRWRATPSSRCARPIARNDRWDASPRHAVPRLSFDRTSVHFDHRTYTLKSEAVSLNTCRTHAVPMILGITSARSGERQPKEAELMFRRGQWFFNLAVESADGEPVACGP